VFIIQGLHEACFVSGVDAGATGAGLGGIDAIWKIGVDSIGVARCDVGFIGSADSKGFTGGAEFLRDDKVGTPTPGVSWIVFILKELNVIFADRFDLIGVSWWIWRGIWTNTWGGKEGTSGGTGWRVAGGWGRGGCGGEHGRR
jgi:hypothetical protein